MINGRANVEAALVRIGALCGKNVSDQWDRWARVAGSWLGARVLLERMANAGGRNQLLDCLCEVRYGLVFDCLGFELMVEPSGRKGPDFSVSRGGVCATVEVSRFTQVNPGPPAWNGDDLLVQYGDPQRDVNKAASKIRGKYPQLTGDCAILALWNDDDALEDFEIEAAVQDLASDPDRPASLQFVLLGSAWHRPGHDLLCFPFEPMNDSVRPWVDDLRAVNMSRVYAETATARTGYPA